MARHTNTIKALLTLTAIALFVSDLSFAFGARPSYAAETIRVDELYNMAMENEGQHALEMLAASAIEVGGWEPAPGDTLQFDKYMRRSIRGAVIDFDEREVACNPETTFDIEMCYADFESKERQVRFGHSLFSTPGDDGTTLRAVGDVYSTFIEEVGHSWQEYMYETEGMAHDRNQTSYEASLYWAPGREYQVKRYILSLDGSVIDLSDHQREMLMVAICTGYANPIGNDVPSYGAPPDWPQPEGWPTQAPTAAELVEFCGPVELPI